MDHGSFLWMSHIELPRGWLYGHTGWMVDVSAAGGWEGQRLEVCSAGGWRAITTDDADGAGTSQGQQAQQGSERLDDLLTGAEFIRKELGSTGLPRVRGAAGSAAL